MSKDHGALLQVHVNGERISEPESSSRGRATANCTYVKVPVSPLLGQVSDTHLKGDQLLGWAAVTRYGMDVLLPAVHLSDHIQDS